ncbi:hypothetical protein EUTSA_v10022491mg [Eutrema salsugineum]|uniref:SWIM-type domain-containing protein n=1 Tax=Eutrema salsugineum TaxID=72664 RepID=V4LGC7_EUTSA|nr:hypothetical protein EUTSA_v10022491mg [Eutrema salsugineum]
MEELRDLKEVQQGHSEILDRTCYGDDHLLLDVPGMSRELHTAQTDIATIKLQLQAIENQGSHYFKHVFISHGASQDGFPFLRKLIVVSGSLLRRSKPLFLIVAVSQDANFQTYPLAFAVVASKTDQAWRWFLLHLQKCFPDNNQMSILSDGGEMVSRALLACYPEANHVDCLCCVQLSVNLYFRDSTLKPLVREAACAHSVGAFHRAFNMIKERSPDCANYLQIAGDRFNLMTAGIAQGFIHSLFPQTSGPIINLFHSYHTIIMLWFRTRLHAAMDHTGIMSPGVQSFMERVSRSKMQWTVIHKSSGSCMVTNTLGEIQFSNPLRRSCSCEIFNKLWIPCVHAMVASDALGPSAESLVHHCYTSVAWFECYISQVHPCQEAQPGQSITTVDIELLPPSTWTIVGRPRSTNP